MLIPTSRVAQRCGVELIWRNLIAALYGWRQYSDCIMRERGRIAWDLGNFLLVNYLSLLVICLKWIRLSHTNFGLTDPSIPLATRLSPSAIRLSNQIGLVNRKLDSSTTNWTRYQRHHACEFKSVIVRRLILQLTSPICHRRVQMPIDESNLGTLLPWPMRIESSQYYIYNDESMFEFTDPPSQVWLM